MHRLELPLDAAESLFAGIAPLPNNRLILRSAEDDGSSHWGPISTQIYGLGGRVPKLLWAGSEADHDHSSILVSGDGKIWGVMAPMPASQEARDRLGVESKFRNVTSGIHFAFGNFKSRKIRRTYAVTFHDWVDDRDTGMSGQDTRFTFLDSDGPVVVAAYADDVYLCASPTRGCCRSRSSR